MFLTAPIGILILNTVQYSNKAAGCRCRLLVETDGHTLDGFGIDRVLGRDIHANFCASRRLRQRWTGNLGANRRSGYER